MPRLYFKKKFHKAIREGTKTSTLRRWSKAKMWAGRIISCPGVGSLKVIDCQKVDLKKLNPADALSDGFPSLADLYKAVEQIYPDHQTDQKHWYRVIFQVTPSKAKCTKPSLAAFSNEDARSRLALAVRAKFDNAVRRSGAMALL